MKSRQPKPSNTSRFTYLALEQLEERCVPSTTAQLLLDLNTDTADSVPTKMIQSGSTTFFLANDGVHGQELWKSNGTEAGTVLVKDIRPGAQDSDIDSLVELNGTIFFRANDGVSGFELWKSDGTEAGTTLVRDIRAGTANSLPNHLVVANDRLFFRANDGVHGIELWSSDGTEAGTVMVKDINPGSGHSLPSELVNVNGVLFFHAQDANSGLELWKSDGSESGTVLVADINPGAGGVGLSELTEVDGQLFMRVDSPNTDPQLWKSDGTAAGTIFIKEFSDLSLPRLESFTNVDDTLFFVALEQGGIELWKSDGTTTGTVQVKDINPLDDSMPTNLTNFNGTLYFRASDGVHGEELWKSDGTESGTIQVKDIFTGSESAAPHALTVVNDTLFFGASDGIHGSELWKTDGTGIGTVLVADSTPGSNGTFIPESIAGNGKLIFRARDTGLFGISSFGSELWTSDGTTEGTGLIKDINTFTLSSHVEQFLQIGATTYFVADDRGNASFFSGIDGAIGRELWKTDGTAEGTVLVKDIRPGSLGSGIQSLTNLNGILYFSASDDGATAQLWKSDGTTEGTEKVTSLLPSDRDEFDNPFLAELVNINDTLYFSGRDETLGVELWKSDGTTEGTVVVADINEVGSSSPASLTEFNGAVYFSAEVGSNRRELWKSNGTIEGTTHVQRFSLPGTRRPNLGGLTESNGSLFFTVETGSEGTELWKTDGTVVGTMLVKDIRPGTQNSSIAELVDMGGTLFFFANDGVHGTELWKSDGTEEGTVLVRDIRSGSSSSSPNSLVAVGNHVYFRATDGIHGSELWKSDGTSVGTSLVLDINPGSGSSSPSELVNQDGILYFNANDGITGEELWQSDGTETGTVLIQDIRPGNSGSAPQNLTVLGDTLIFTADDGQKGREIWTFTKNIPPIAEDDFYSLNEDEALTLSPESVLDNDDIPNNRAVIVLLESSPNHGQLLFNADGTFTYTPDPDFNGSDSFSYKINNGPVDSNIATVTLNITPVNDAPVVNAGADQIVNEGENVNLNGTFSDEDTGDSHTLLWQVIDANNNVVVTANSSILSYVPTDNGLYTANFTVTDNEGASESDTTIITVINVPPIPDIDGPTSGVRGQLRSFIGSLTDPGSGDTHSSRWEVRNSSNVLIATASGNNFDFTPTLSGKYTINYIVTDDDGATVATRHTLTVNDVEVQTDPSNPKNKTLVIGGTKNADNILLRRGSSNQSVQVFLEGKTLGSFIADSLEVFGQAGDDTITVDQAISLNAILHGDDGNDLLNGGAGNDSLQGGKGNDIFKGGAGFDFAFGDDGNDIASSDLEKFVGGAGQDGITFEGTKKNDHIRIRWLPGPFVEAEINGETTQVEYAEGETIFVYAGKGNDLVVMEESGGLRWTAEFHGEKGNDVLIGSEKGDRLFGGKGNDLLVGGAGNDILIGGKGRDILLGNAGRDLLIGGKGFDVLLGGSGDDLLIGGFTNYDSNVEALNVIMQEWTSERSYDERVNLLRTGIESDGETIKLNRSTVHDDRTLDIIHGGEDRDWYFASMRRGGRDWMTDLEEDELINHWGEFRYGTGRSSKK